ncbi:CoA transferase [Pseudohalioglobus sediminis]|uniref:CoA transferase n=1 Tax=Pseudohalioglobus sediminis TaxID=2606449 RepID=A0A5B0X4E1_9GAMM|nr:CoA transferase [Pseudohalioglobus sediminis]KAA1193437.1 CoA transferase [Pseudohalioglobus sediminis]
MTAPLEGIRIVEMTSVVLGPYACQMLGDLGADVIKIEPPGGDTNRHLGPHRNHSDMCSMYLGCNRNKRSVALDLKSPRGRQAALDIISSADVVVHNFRPQAMARLGLDYDAVRTVNPEIIYCATYGYSKRGPYGDKGALDDSIQAASGAAALAEKVLGEPRYMPTIIADKTTAMFVVQSVLAALFYKLRTGEGQEIEVPMYESMVSFVMTEHLWGQSFEPPLGEAGYVRLMAEHRKPYRCKDGKYLAVLPYWDNHWLTFCELAGRPELATDARFIDMATRLKNINESYRVTGEIIAGRSRQEWLDLLGDTKVPTMVVNSLDDLIDDPHLVATGFWQQMAHPTEGQLRLSSPPMNMSRTQPTIRRHAPRLGENTAEVLAEAGYAQEDIDSLVADGAAMLEKV